MTSSTTIISENRASHKTKSHKTARLSPNIQTAEKKTKKIADLRSNNSIGDNNNIDSPILRSDNSYVSRKKEDNFTEDTYESLSLPIISGSDSHSKGIIKGSYKQDTDVENLVSNSKPYKERGYNFRNDDVTEFKIFIDEPIEDKPNKHLDKTAKFDTDEILANVGIKTSSNLKLDQSFPRLRTIKRNLSKKKRKEKRNNP